MSPSSLDFVHVIDVTVLLRLVRPHVHAKGRDYTRENVPERAVAKEVGAQIATVGDPKDHSLTDLLKRISARTDASAQGRTAGKGGSG